MIAFTPDERLPYVITSSIVYGTDAMRILRCTVDGKIASGSEHYDAPIIDIAMADFAGECFRAVRIITPNQETAHAIATATGASAISIDDFKTLVRRTAVALKASERETRALAPRQVFDGPSSGYASAQELYSLLVRQMPRVQAAMCGQPSDN